MANDLVLADLPRLAPLLARGLAPRARRGGGAALPDRAAVVASHPQDVARLARYDRVCGFTLRDRVPPTWLHVLTFPLQVALMADRGFPFALPGLVHTANTMTLHRPVTIGDVLTLRVRPENLRAHRRGALFDMVGHVRVGDELVWEGTSTYLAPGAELPPGAGEHPRPEATEAPTPSQEWRLPADLGRRYAGVSADVNPIHLHPVTARLFGLRRPIAHGMWTHARALAALEGRLPETFSVDVRFARPIPLPGRVRFAARDAGGSTTFAVLGSEDRPHLVGEVRPTPSRPES